MVAASRSQLDFDPKGKGGFYLTEDRDVAANWSARKAQRKREDAKERGSVGPEDRPVPTLYSYDVDETAITERLEGVTFETYRDKSNKIQFTSKPERLAWQRWVFASRSGLKEHDEDYVRGPMISNPTIVAGIKRNWKQESSEKKRSQAELDVIAEKHVRWDPDADQIALYSPKAMSLFEEGRQPRDILEWDDRDYLGLEVKHQIQSARQQIANVKSMSRDDRAWLLYNNRLLAESQVAKDLANELKQQVIERLFPSKTVRELVWAQVRLMENPPGSIAYEYYRFINNLPADYDLHILSQLPGIQQAMVAENAKPSVPKSDAKKESVKKQGVTLSENARRVLMKIYSNGGKVVLSNSKDQKTVQVAFGMEPDEFFAAYNDLAKRKLATHDQNGPFLTENGMSLAKEP